MERRARGWNERRFRNLASGPGDGRRGGGADRVVGERSVEAEFTHAWAGLASAVQVLLEYLQGQIAFFAAEDVPAEEQFDRGAVVGNPPAIAMAAHRFAFGPHHPGGSIRCGGLGVQQSHGPRTCLKAMAPQKSVPQTDQRISTVEIKSEDTLSWAQFSAGRTWFSL